MWEYTPYDVVQCTAYPLLLVPGELCSREDLWSGCSSISACIDRVLDALVVCSAVDGLCSTTCLRSEDVLDPLVSRTYGAMLPACYASTRASLCMS